MLTDEKQPNMPPVEGAANEARDAGSLDEIVRLAAAGLSPEATVRRAAQAVAAQFGSPIATISVRIGPRDFNDTVGADDDKSRRWQRVLDSMALDVRAAPRAVGRLYAVDDASPIGALAAPITSESGTVLGALAVVAACESRDVLEARVTELRAVCAAVSTALVGSAVSQHAGDDGSASGAAIGRASAYTSLTELGFAMTNNLRNKLGCDQVIMGVPRGPRMRIIAISGHDDVKPRSPGTAAARAALEETLDEQRPLCFQHDDKWQGERVSTGHRLHRAWHESAGSASVASVPLFAGDRVSAVLGLRRRGDRPFTQDEMKSITEMVQPFGAAVPVVARATRGLPAHAVDATRSIAASLASPKGWGRRAAALGMILFVAWFCFGTMTYRLSVNAEVAPYEVTVLSAPFAGMLAEVNVEPGDAVRAGDALCRLDTRELELQAAEARAEIAAFDIDIDQAVGSGDIASATLASARRRASVARLNVLEYRIDNAVVRAASDGIVLSGGLRERVGQLVPLGEPLFEFAPGEQLRVELLASQNEVDEIVAGLGGRFAASARPGEKQGFKITSVRPASEVRDGDNIYLAEASFTTQPDWMKAGMQGVARIEVGERRVWWVALHRVSDFLRMRLWL